MNFWQTDGLKELLVIAALLLGAATLRRLVSLFRRPTMPDSMIAGFVGLLFGPSGLALFNFKQDFMEIVVYHALALVFISIGLQSPLRGNATGNARSMAIGIPLIAMLQGALGLIMLLIWAKTKGETLHPGFGLMLPLAFSQGPGQALSLGASWEASGMTQGAQIGLIMAAIGFGWCALVGVPIISLAKKRGWTLQKVQSINEPERPPIPVKSSPPGGMETLTLQLVWIGVVYLITFLILHSLNAILFKNAQLSAMIWGFHFVIAGIIAMVTRRLIMFSKKQHRLNDNLLGRIAGTTVDIATVAAFAAIKIEVFLEFFWPIFIMTTVTGLFTLLFSLWLSKRAFTSSPFEHAIVLFGTSTGTLPTGLALLRILDPDLKGPVASSTVLGATAAIIFGAPLLLVVIPTAVKSWPESFPIAVYIALGMLVIYGIILIIGWRFMGTLRYIRPLHNIWPMDEEND